ncbi:hypothetical protein PENPOL_c002G04732 [Penicillium polonicum]|uniref:Uncharacterized protein n=1 Tax=Penicillium polonicum TaxID=60169 RepID=A0A1V6NYR9_PENPO|nr:hypothetical protein PENPOL_c002G04732 [Penicillium polonicum]
MARGLFFLLILIWTLLTLPDCALELVVALAVLVELTKELVMMIDNSITTESNNTSTKANSTSISLESVLDDIYTASDAFYLLILFFNDRNIDPMSLLEQIDVGILVAALASALPDRDGDIPMR